MSEEQAEYLTDAMEMMGAGYDHPTVVIEPPRTITARHNGRMVEVEEPAWVKFSTDFKKELKQLDEFSLKVFLYIGLSVNWKTGEAWPGVRKIAEETGMNKDTVTRAVESLEAAGYLEVCRRDGSSNRYKPVRFISVGVRSGRTVLSDEKTELSDENVKLSDASRVNLHNKINKNNQNNGGKPPVSLAAEEIEQATRKADAILGLANPADPSKAWVGRDKIRPDLLHYADWYNKATGQEMTKRVQKSWWKAMSEWKDEGLEIKHLQEAYEARSKWRTVADPNELTKDAAAIKALGDRQVQQIMPEGKSSGYYG